MATKAKQPHLPPRPRVGDTRWVVQWCTKIGMADDEHPEYGTDPDRDVMRSRYAGSREEAERIAREVFPLDVRGVVEFWPVEFVPYDEADAARYPHVGFWECTADSEYYEGPEEAQC